jgi:hypothetical protein
LNFDGFKYIIIYSYSMFTRDPLILYGTENAEVTKGAEALKKHVFRPTPMTMQWLTGGNGQTILCELKCIV